MQRKDEERTIEVRPGALAIAVPIPTEDEDDNIPVRPAISRVDTIVIGNGMDDGETANQVIQQEQVQEQEEVQQSVRTGTNEMITKSFQMCSGQLHGQKHFDEK